MVGVSAETRVVARACRPFETFRSGDVAASVALHNSRRVRQMSSAESNWDEVEAQVRRIVAECAEPFDPATVANAGDVLAVIRNHFAIPEVFQGYWPTIRFCWSDEWEIEVFSDRVEVYRFPADGRFDVRHYSHFPGEPFSAELMTELSSSEKSA
jgi:hypothetical protein